MSLQSYVRANVLSIVAALAILALGVAYVVSRGIDITQVLTPGYVNRSMEAAVPIALAAIGGLYTERSGVFNIGLEGFMIFGAVNAAAMAWILADGSGASQSVLWAALALATLISLLYTVVYAVLTIRYEANQIVAGLAVWLLGLGFGPFTAVLMWDGISSPPIASINSVTVPLLADIPVVGSALFDVNPLVWLTIVITIAAWVVLYKTRYGYWIRAAGDNPSALDTAGVSVNRVRYATVLFSGTIAGFAGGVISIGLNNGFTGSGQTIVGGQGFIAIVAYLFGNYNPIGATLSALLFGAADQLQIQLQTVGVDVPGELINLVPYVAVIIVLTLFGATRMPSAVGESYKSEE